MSHLCSIRSESCSLLTCTSVMFCHALLSYGQQGSLYRLLLPPAIKSWCHLTTLKIKALSKSCRCKESDWLRTIKMQPDLGLQIISLISLVNKAFMNYVKSKENRRDFLGFLHLLSEWTFSISNVDYLDKQNKPAVL